MKLESRQAWTHSWSNKPRNQRTKERRFSKNRESSHGHMVTGRKIFARGQQVALVSYDAEVVIYSARLSDRKNWRVSDFNRTAGSPPISRPSESERLFTNQEILKLWTPMFLVQSRCHNLNHGLIYFSIIPCFLLLWVRSGCFGMSSYTERWKLELWSAEVPWGERRWRKPSYGHGWVPRIIYSVNYWDRQIFRRGNRVNSDDKFRYALAGLFPWR